MVPFFRTLICFLRIVKYFSPHNCSKVAHYIARFAVDSRLLMNWDSLFLDLLIDTICTDLNNAIYSSFTEFSVTFFFFIKKTRCMLQHVMGLCHLSSCESAIQNFPLKSPTKKNSEN